MSNKVWVECLMRDKGALAAFQEFLREQEDVHAHVAVAQYQANDEKSSQMAAATSLAWKSIKEQIAMYLREEEQNVLIQER